MGRCKLWKSVSFEETGPTVKDYVVFQMDYMHSQTQCMIIILMNEGMNC